MYSNQKHETENTVPGVTKRAQEFQRCTNKYKKFYQTKNYVLPNKVICFTKQKTDFFIRRAKPKCQTKQKPTKNYVLPNKVICFTEKLQRTFKNCYLIRGSIASVIKTKL